MAATTMAAICSTFRAQSSFSKPFVYNIGLASGNAQIAVKIGDMMRHRVPDFPEKVTPYLSFTPIPQTITIPAYGNASMAMVEAGFWQATWIPAIAEILGGHVILQPEVERLGISGQRSEITAIFA